MSEVCGLTLGPFAQDHSLVDALCAIPPGRRATVLQAAMSGHTIDDELAPYVTVLPDALNAFWICRHKCEAPFDTFAKVLAPPIPIRTVMAFCRLKLVRDRDEMGHALNELIKLLESDAVRLGATAQLSLTGELAGQASEPRRVLPVGKSVGSLGQLVSEGHKFGTIYADPPWAYQNEASRAAAVNHYPVMSTEAICNEPVRELAAPDSHLHLWTTNAFLPEAFQVIDAWGFAFKSCLVWIKHELGMGNYWRVSHEFLLLGVRGRLTFRDRTIPSWLQAHRTLHSRKPGIVRTLVEKVSPGPYLELYGREELPNSAWTVYGNQVEKRFF